MVGPESHNGVLRRSQVILLRVEAQGKLFSGS